MDHFIIFKNMLLLYYFLFYFSSTDIDWVTVVHGGLYHYTLGNTTEGQQVINNEPNWDGRFTRKKITDGLAMSFIDN